jgi:hypothetical protein
MPDEIEEMFANLDVYYPGSKRKRREDSSKKLKRTVEDSDWTTSAVFKRMPNGQLFEFYQLGALAQALGRPLVTVRYWMKEGYLPAAPYRLGDKKDRNGNESRGRRLYSRAQIQAVVDLFEKAGYLELNRIEWPDQQLTNAIAEAWDAIKRAELT